MLLEREEDDLIELSEGYKVRKKEDTEISLEWDTTSGDGIYLDYYALDLRLFLNFTIEVYNWGINELRTDALV